MSPGFYFVFTDVVTFVLVGKIAQFLVKFTRYPVFIKREVYLEESHVVKTPRGLYPAQDLLISSCKQCGSKSRTKPFSVMNPIIKLLQWGSGPCGECCSVPTHVYHFVFQV
jgi:hypothetical protein